MHVFRPIVWSVLGLTVAVLITGMMGSGVWRAGGRAPHRIDLPAASASTVSEPGPSGGPKAVIEKSEHLFGIIDPCEEVAYTFVIRNEGRAPLELARGSTSCKCTMSDLPEQAVPPGGKLAVRVSSKVHQKEGDFHHTATILSNDPKNPKIPLSLRGTIRTYLGAHPPSIQIPACKRGVATTGSVVVYSQVWDRFELGPIQASLPELTWRIEQAEADALDALGARSGYRIYVTIPPTLPEGKFGQWLQVTATPKGNDAGRAEPRTLALDITGTVLGKVTVEGPRVDVNGVLQIGTVRSGEGARERLLLKFRVDDPSSAIQRIETTPDFLRVRVLPSNPKAATLGLYQIDVEVPGDAPPSSYLGETMAEIRIITNVPKLPVVKVPVAFAVTSR